MYEAEVNGAVESVDTLPEAIVRRFGELRAEVTSRTLLPWGEHCTECAWPTCYTTCELYSPRIDGNCRLFVDGMVRIDVEDAVRPYLLKLRFKRWGKLWTVGNLALYAPPAAGHKEKMNMLIGATARSVPLPRPLKSRVLGKVAHRRRVAAEMAPASGQSPDCFLVECYNPGPRPVTLTLTIRPRGSQTSGAFQQALRVPIGFVREQIALAGIAATVDLGQPFEVEIVPNEADDTLLYFGLLDFVTLHGHPRMVSAPAPVAEPTTAAKPAPAKTWKCIVWDLDNTVWDGTLIEDGPEGIRLRPDAVAVIEETDRRGILHSIASKNNPEDVMAALRRFGLAEYFLYPQVSWEPKSHAIASIAQLLSIGVETLAFVDDQTFEREEVRSALPQVALVDAADLAGIPARSECQVPVTEESRQRRVMYREEETRERIRESFPGDYTTFLRDCRIELLMTRLTGENLERVYELAQRTNQMNFSGARYARATLEELSQSAEHETYVIRCRDRFGTYGIVGFGVVESREPRLVDLMFSCRIQSKRVEHAVLAHMLRTFGQPDRRDFFANFRKTDKNASHGKVFEEIGFEVAEERDGVVSLVFRRDRPVPDDGIVDIIDESTRERA